MPRMEIDLNTHDMMLSSVHGHHKKELIVVHETVSPDIAGMADIIANVTYLDRIDYGLYAAIDLEGHNAVALGLGKAIFYVQGGENERGIGIELVSPIPALLQKRVITLSEATALWKSRKKQLDELAKLCACLSTAQDIPLTYRADCDAGKGICGHWNVSQKHSQSDGHTDCWPIQEGGYFPINYVIYKARVFKGAGWTF